MKLEKEVSLSCCVQCSGLVESRFTFFMRQINNEKKKKKKIISWGSGDHMHNYEVSNGIKTYFGHKTAKIISRYA